MQQSMQFFLHRCLYERSTDSVQLCTSCEYSSAMGSAKTLIALHWTSPSRWRAAKIIRCFNLSHMRGLLSNQSKSPSPRWICIQWKVINYHLFSSPKSFLFTILQSAGLQCRSSTEEKVSHNAFRFNTVVNNRTAPLASTYPGSANAEDSSWKISAAATRALTVSRKILSTN